MKKILAILMILVLTLGTLTACGTKDDKKDDTKVGTNQEDKVDKKEDDKSDNDVKQPTDDTFEIALITDKGNIDDKSFNQGSWEGVVEFATANNISHQYYKPEEASDAGYLAAIDLAISGGAKVVVTPGFLFEVAMYEAQTKHPEVKFILLDGAPHTADYSVFETKENVASVMYAEEESGYLAGYAAVMDGMRKLGFMGGMAVPAVQAFGYGYLLGAQDAAKELGLGAGEVEVIYHYTGNFEENDTNKATAKTMYQEGTEVIFACGGSVGKSVMAAASEAGAKVIGVDVDQRYDSDTVITSATKGLGASVIQVLEAIYKSNKWDTFGGTTTYFNATNDGVGLPTEVIGDASGNAFDRFASFNMDQYKAVYAKLVDGSVDPVREITVADAGGVATADELVSGLSLVEVKVEVR
ncbi:MAG: BMP family ABC transporter substrate-binding protein [Anaerolineaceae bacterium]|nr:MAG: BMP family ABC transporter substrate-binding protein [Anaerolineaceae bacterium]